MSSSSSFRARLESLPLRYSAPAGGYAPMPSPDDAAGIGDRGMETGHAVRVGLDGYGIVASEPPRREAARSAPTVSESVSTPEVPAAPIFGVVQAPAPAGYGVVQPRPRSPEPATSSSKTADVLDSPIFGAVRSSAASAASSVESRASAPHTAPTADTADIAGTEGAADTVDTIAAAGTADAVGTTEAAFPTRPAPSASVQTTYGIVPPSPAVSAPLQEAVRPAQTQAPASAQSVPTTPAGTGPMELNPPERTEPLIPTAIAWESVASAASDAAARPLSEQAAQDDSEAEAASAGAAELFQVPEEPEPEPDDDALPDGVPEDGVYVDVDVAIVMESTYPYLKGGVSAVVHDIITGNPDLTFGIIHITWDSHSPLKDLYGMPDNVAWVRVLYLSMEEHQEDFLRARPRDLRMNRRQRRELSRRILGAMLALAQEGRTEPLWEIISEGLSASRRYPVWAILGTREFMEAYHDMMPDLGMSMTDIFWCLRDFFSLAYAVLAEPVPRAAVYHAHTTGYAMLLSVNAAREHGTRVLLTEHNLYVRDTVNTLLERRLDLNIKLTDYRTFDVTGRERMWMAWWLEMGRLCYPYAYASTYLYPRAITEANELGGDSGRAIVIPNGIVT